MVNFLLIHTTNPYYYQWVVYVKTTNIVQKDTNINNLILLKQIQSSLIKMSDVKQLGLQVHEFQIRIFVFT